jgi:hypothetical protein
MIGPYTEVVHVGPSPVYNNKRTSWRVGDRGRQIPDRATVGKQELSDMEVLGEDGVVGEGLVGDC